MGFFNFVVNITAVALKVTLSPVALVADIVLKVTTGENFGFAEGVIKSACKDLKDAVGDILP